MLFVFFGDPNSNGNKEDAVACVFFKLSSFEKILEIKEYQNLNEFEIIQDYSRFFIRR